MSQPGQPAFEGRARGEPAAYAEAMQLNSRSFFIARDGDDYDNARWVPPHPDDRPITGYFVDGNEVTEDEYNRLHTEWHTPPAE